MLKQQQQNNISLHLLSSIKYLKGSSKIRINPQRFWQKSFLNIAVFKNKLKKKR